MIPGRPGGGHGYKYETEGEKMSGTAEGWNGRKLPKNIRQVGETEGQNRIYLEDYVYTYVRKTLEKRGGQAVAGFLTGIWEDREDGRYYFIKGAMVVEGMLSAKESVIAGTPLWKKNRELAEYYFPGQELVGWFLHSREEGFFDETEKQAMHRHIFPQGESLLFQFEEEENRMCFGNENGLTPAGGYYIYYERNVDMQNYMLDTGQAVPEEISLDDTAILQYRSIMKERKSQAGRKQEILLKRACIGLTAAVVFLSLYTWGEQRDALPKETSGSDIVAVGASVEAEGNSGQTENLGENSGQGGEERGDGVQTNKEENGAQTDEEGESGVQMNEGGENSGQSHGTEENQGQTGGGGALDTQGIPEQEVDVNDQSISQTDSSAEEQNPSESADAGAGEDQAQNASVSLPGAQLNYYEVQSGDTLVGICLTFYGTTEVLGDICQLNEISNPALIYNGQRIYLP